MKDEQAEVMLKMLSEHFGEPVMPVSRYCSKLELYAHAIDQRARRTKEKGDIDHADQVQWVFVQIMKSNLLHRLIYQGEKLRTVPCPEHKGKWSGLYGPCECGFTGWLPEKS